MRKMFCDLCGKEIEVTSGYSPYTFTLPIFNNRDEILDIPKEICYNCKNKIARYIETLKQEAE
jgi:hypothetical protein